MSHGTLKWLRFATPSLLMLVFAYIVGKVTGAWDITIPEKPADFLPTGVALGLSFAYDLTPLRNMANSRYFARVTEKLRTGLLGIAGVQDAPERYPWNLVRPIFWRLVDNDKSLTNKASLAYFNGFLWTMAADIRALATLFLLLSLFGWYLIINNADLCALIFALVLTASFFISIIVTRRHINIGAEQLEIIERYHKKELTEKLEEIT